MAEGIHCHRHLCGSANRDDDAVDARPKVRRHSSRSIARRLFGLWCELPFLDRGSRQCTWTVPLLLGFRVPIHRHNACADRSRRIDLVHLDSVQCAAGRSESGIADAPATHVGSVGQRTLGINTRDNCNG